mmetsp:Transcript_41108/g.97530  ORF Transcript_41108/g.97530 Transcript_41108/m.97530 type:complete len:101 (+) Transcript_41108:198-500(+)
MPWLLRNPWLRSGHRRLTQDQRDAPEGRVVSEPTRADKRLEEDENQEEEGLSIEEAVELVRVTRAPSTSLFLQLSQLSKLDPRDRDCVYLTDVAALRSCR